jgi:hypothetical protein
MHFALEDFHGYHRFDRPSDAFTAYVSATSRTPGIVLPSDWEEASELMRGMLDYYLEWLEYRDPQVTLEIGGVPQVEVRFQIPLPLDPSRLLRFGYDRAVYTGTIDRVILDEEFQRLWLVDYKSAKAIQTGHFETDPQITAYCWAASQIYTLPVAGFLYQQHRKAVAHEPDFLKSTRQFSVNKNMLTTHTLYAKALKNLYGTAEAAPEVNIAFLNQLASEETERADKLIRLDQVERSQYQLAAEGPKIIAEAADMLDPNLSIYPNPTRDCSWDCDFRTACLSMDDGSDWEYEIETGTMDRDEENLNWRNFLVYPSRPEPLPRFHVQHRQRRQQRR